MTRMSSQHWKCVICGGKAVGEVVCMTCSFREKEKQRAQPGTISRKQLGYIEHLLTKLDTQTTSRIIYGEIPDYSGELENLSTYQAGELIPKLLENIPEENEVGSDEH
jgi:hypothetical protein